MVAYVDSGFKPCHSGSPAEQVLEGASNDILSRVEQVASFEVFE